MLLSSTHKHAQKCFPLPHPPISHRPPPPSLQTAKSSKMHKQQVSLGSIASMKPSETPNFFYQLHNSPDIFFSLGFFQSRFTNYSMDFKKSLEHAEKWITQDLVKGRSLRTIWGSGSHFRAYCIKFLHSLKFKKKCLPLQILRAKFIL